MNKLENEIQHYFREILGVLSTDEIISNEELITKADLFEKTIYSKIQRGTK